MSVGPGDGEPVLGCVVGTFLAAFLWAALILGYWTCQEAGVLVDFRRLPPSPGLARLLDTR